MSNDFVKLVKLLQEKFPNDPRFSELVVPKPKGPKPIGTSFIVRRSGEPDLRVESWEELAKLLKISLMSLRVSMSTTKGIWERPRSKTTIFWVSKIGEDHPALQAEDPDDDFSMIPAKVRKNARNREELVFLREHEYGGKRNPFTKARKQA